LFAAPAKLSRRQSTRRLSCVAAAAFLLPAAAFCQTAGPSAVDDSGKQPLQQLMTFSTSVGSDDSTSLPDAPSAILEAYQTQTTAPAQLQPRVGTPDQQKPQPGCDGCELDANGKPIPLERQQPKRILGFMPNFRSVSGGAVPHPPGWKYNFTVATHQAFDYSSFIFLFLTTISAEGLNEHPVLRKGVRGFYAYGWRGFLDKTDGNYLGGWFLPSLLHEDTRYYAKGYGSGHGIVYRELYVMSRQVVTRTYSQHDTPNIAGLGGKVLAQLVSRTYYPTGATSFGVLAEKFGYATMRDIGFTTIREFYPDVAAHYVKKHKAKAAAKAALDAQAAGTTSPTATH
jgi:hypothetical protein